MSINSISISGNLTKDPELRKTQGGKDVCSFTIAVSENRDKAHFINCVAWEKLAETIANYTRKGQPLSVSGKLSTRNYEKDDGTKVYVTEVVAYQVQLPPKEQSTYTGPAQAAAPVDEFDDSGDIPF